MVRALSPEQGSYCANNKPLVVRPPGPHVAGELVPAKDPVERDRHVGDRHEADDPGDGPLRGAHVHQGVQHVKRPEGVRQQHEERREQGHCLGRKHTGL